MEILLSKRLDMTTEKNQLTIHQQEILPLNRSLPSEHEMMVFTTISKQAAESKLYNNYGTQAGIMMTILAARELGIPPMLALNGGLANIQGKIEISARLMNAMMRRAGIKISILTSTDEICTLKGQRSDGDNATVSYSIEDARKAGLIKPGGGWVKNPKDMCFARAISRLARQIAPDIIGGCYIEGEIKPTDPETITIERNIPNEKIDGYECDDTEIVLTDEDNMQKLLERFGTEDEPLVLEYIQVVSKHFGWSQSQCVNKFLEEKNLLDKFNTWKAKRKTI